MSNPGALIKELEQALSDGSAERRVKMLNRITDLFVIGSGQFTEDHIALMDGVFGHLIAHIEQAARAALATRLAGIANAPPALMRTLAFDDSIDVAGPVLKQSERLDNVTLVENANAKSQQHLMAISQRKVIAETVTDVLVERGNRDVAISTARNAGAKLSEIGYVRLVRRSEGDDELAQTVGSRTEIPHRHFVKLLSKASQAVRQKLGASHPEFTREIERAVAETASGIQAKAAASSHNYAAARAHVESLRAAGRLDESQIEGFARAGKFEETTVALSLLCNLPIGVIEHAMVQDRRETILIIARACGLSWLTAKAVLLLRSGKAGMSAQSLEQCMADFARLKRETAEKVVEFQRARSLAK